MLYIKRIVEKRGESMKVEIDVWTTQGVKEDSVNIKLRGSSEMIEEILKSIKTKYVVIK